MTPLVDARRSGPWRVRSLLVACTVLASAWSIPAIPAAAAEADKAAAKAHYEAATRLYDVHDYARAIEEYKAAYLAKPDPAFLFNMGQCYRKLGKRDQALQFFRDYLRKAPAGDANREIVEARVRELEAGGGMETEPASTSASTPPAAGPTPPVPPGTAGATWPATPAAEPSAAQPAGVDLSAATSPSEPAAPAPVYTKWWFWTGVGTVVLAGTVTAILLANRGDRTLTADGTLGTRSVFQ